MGELGGKGDAGAMGSWEAHRARKFKFKDQRTKEEGRLGNLYE